MRRTPAAYGIIPTMSEHLNRELKRRMKDKGFKPKSLSLEAGLGETYVADILKGRSANPTHTKLSALARELDCTIADLTGERRPLDRNALSIAVREVLWCIERLESTMAEETVILCVLAAYRRYQDETVDDRETFSKIAKKVVDDKVT